LNIFSFNDLLHHYPFRYIDRTKIYKVEDINSATQNIQLVGELGSLKEIGVGHKKRLTATFKDDTGKIELVWFKGANWLKNSLKVGATYLLFGKPTLFNKKFNFSHPELSLYDNSSKESLSGFEPVYPSTDKLRKKGLDSKGIFKLQQNLIHQLNQNRIDENLPEYLLEQFQLINRLSAYRKIHLPKNEKEIEQAERRLKFEELFLLQMNLLLMRGIRKATFKGYKLENVGEYFNNYYKKVLPFELTNAQKRVLKEIRLDVKSGKHMNRLLQGDVGSGKTIVAVMTILMAIDNGFQAALMAPTEILAQQHFKGIYEELKKIGIDVAILTGSIKGKKRAQTLHYLKEGNIKVLIGTHALIENPVVFKNLGLAVIDEQHRFGVKQRSKLWKKNKQPPHVLVMTATPIPRTLAMTVYGDLDVSVIDELPPGRKSVITTHRNDAKRLSVFGFIKDEIKKGRQVYIVYPLIEESAKLDLKDLTDGYESICRAFPNNQVSIVHGRMKAADKEFEMQRFLKQETQIMVATTVIEVGVNVPNASIMVIENAERFGLSQLHQLRGRVGRGADQSFCILMTGKKLSNDARKRIKTMVATTDGFKISEVDLEIRGPGNIEGTQQSGLPSLKIANILKDNNILIAARNAAIKIIEEDENLEKESHQVLKKYLQKNKKQNIGWENIS